MNGLEAIEKLRQLLAYEMDGINFMNEVEVIEKYLRALEIIKNKEINIHSLLLHLKRFDSPDGYNVLVGEKYKLSQKEYDLLKEVVIDDN